MSTIGMIAASITQSFRLSILSANNPRYKRAENRDHTMPILCCSKGMNMRVSAKLRITTMDTAIEKASRIAEILFGGLVRVEISCDVKNTHGHVMIACVRIGPHIGPHCPLKLNTVGNSNGDVMSTTAIPFQFLSGKRSNPRNVARDVPAAIV